VREHVEVTGHRDSLCILSLGKSEASKDYANGIDNFTIWKFELVLVFIFCVDLVSKTLSKFEGHVIGVMTNVSLAPCSKTSGRPLRSDLLGLRLTFLRRAYSSSSLA
jgi:hypothetical protein